MNPFKIQPVAQDGTVKPTRTVKYPAGTSPAEVARHQIVRNGYGLVTVRRAYANPFGNAPFSYWRNQL